MKRDFSNKNYNKENNTADRAALEESFRRNDGPYTIMQRNSPCKVTITKESRKICADILTKI